MRRIVLLRHGQTASNAEGRIQGQIDTDLNEVGLIQAEALGTVFAADPPEKVVSSDLARARRTAQAVCDHIGVPLLVDERLRETHFGAWQGLTGDEVRAGWPEEYDAWRRHEGDPVGGETTVDVAVRARACVEEHLPVVRRGREQEDVGDDELLADVEQQDVLAELVSSGLGSRGRELDGAGGSRHADQAT